MLDFLGKDFKSALTSMFKELKETILKELKETMMIMSHQIEKINRGIQISLIFKTKPKTNRNSGVERYNN